MIIGYIKKENIGNRLFRRIEIRNFDNNYVIAIPDKYKKRQKQKLVKYIQKLKIDAIVFSKDFQEELKLEICNMLSKTNVQILIGKKLMEFMEYEIVKYVLDKQNTNSKQEDVYIIFKKTDKLNLDFLKKFIENFRMVNIVTNDIEKLKRIQDNLLDNEGTLISVSNNKKKALKRAKYIVNINLNKEELNKYTINRDAIIINIQENVKYDSTSFDGININYFDIQCPDEFVETFEQIGENFDIVQMYESMIFRDNMHKTQLDNVYKRISEDGIQITGLIGNNGKITDEELQKIHKLNLDKIRKLV